MALAILWVPSTHVSSTTHTVPTQAARVGSDTVMHLPTIASALGAASRCVPLGACPLNHRSKGLGGWNRLRGNLVTPSFFQVKEQRAFKNGLKKCMQLSSMAVEP